MAPQYGIEDLVRLRASPLVHKPSSLLPVEEWMGPLPDLNQRKPTSRGKTEDTLTNDGPSSRRPLFEARASRGSNNVPEDIILGPPKTAFTSAGARATGRTFDSSNRPSWGQTDGEPAKDDRPMFKERFGSREIHRGDKDGEPPRESRLGTLQNRRGTKDDNESWGSARQHKGTGSDGAERALRRNGDREQDKDREGGRDTRGQRGFDNHRRDAEREGSGDASGRRNGPVRGRHEPSWHRDKDRQDGEGLEIKMDTARVRDWRDKEKTGLRGADRDRNKLSRQEQDPEWMAEPRLEEKMQAHTQEDFERWKERMKASNGPSLDTPQSPVEREPKYHERTTSTTSNNQGKVKVETPLLVDPSFDGFFGLWNQPLDQSTAKGIQEKPTKFNFQKDSTPKPSRFQGFFDPPKVTPAQAAPEPAPLPIVHSDVVTKDSSSEDKEGFQRILKLLDQQQPSAARNGTPPREQRLRNMPVSPPIHPPRFQDPSGGLEGLLTSQTPKEGPPPQNRDSEFLLKLMQQPQQTRSNAHPVNFIDNQRLGVANMPSILPSSNLVISPRDAVRHTPTTGPPPGFYNEIGREDTQHRDKLNPTATPDRKGPMLGFSETPNAGNTQRHAAGGTGHHAALLSGLQRPPGLEQIPLSFTQQLNQPQRQGMIPPPPGFQQMPLRNQNPFPPGLMPNPSNPNITNERAAPYGMRPASNGMAGMPPPGFVGMSAPPPGFAPLPFSQEGRMSPSGRMYLNAGPQRLPMEGYGENANFGGGVQQGMPPGQYRRQE